MTISQRIFDVMYQKKLKQKDLAEYINVSTATVSAWNKKNINPPVELIYKIAEFLGVSLQYLIMGEENKNSVAMEHDSQINNKIDDNIQEIQEIMDNLTQREKTKLMSIIYDFDDQCKEKRKKEQEENTEKSGSKKEMLNRGFSFFAKFKYENWTKENMKKGFIPVQLSYAIGSFASPTDLKRLTYSYLLIGLYFLNLIMPSITGTAPTLWNVVVLFVVTFINSISSLDYHMRHCNHTQSFIEWVLFSVDCIAFISIFVICMCLIFCCITYPVSYFFMTRIMLISLCSNSMSSINYNIEKSDIMWICEKVKSWIN